MKMTTIFFSVLFASMGPQTVVSADEIETPSRYDLLDKMIKIIETKSDDQQAEMWFKSLSKEDFLRGLRQVNDKLVEHKQNTQETNGEYLIGYASMAARFAQYYFRVYPDSSPEPFLRMAENHSMDGYYREIILDIMGDDDFYSLGQDYFDVFCNILLAIISDESNPISLREKAVDCLYGSTARLFHEKRNADHRLKEKKKLDEILKMPKDQFPVETWDFLEKLSHVSRTLEGILLKTSDAGLTSQERGRLIRMLKRISSSGNIIEPNLIEQMAKRAAELQEINDGLPVHKVQEFLKSLKDAPNSLDVIELFSDNFNYNGVLYSKQKLKETTFLLHLINRFSCAKANITVENLQAFSRHEYSRFFERSRFPEQYPVNLKDVFWMVHFEIHTYLIEFNKGFVDGVFIGLDQQDKIAAWFD